MTDSLSKLKTFVPDAFGHAPERPFKPENIVLGVYTFLPWVRTGIASAVQDPPPGATRASVTVTFPVQGDGVEKPVVKTLAVRGPGDVRSFEEGQVVRRYPEPGTTNAEDSFLAHIEFDRPDFPWLFSPQAPAGDRLKPWLALVVVRTALGQVVPGSAGLPPRLRTVHGELQPLDDAWAWAHAQVLGGPADATTASVEDRLSAAYAPVNLSRLVCPRRLEPTTSYLACVVPAFDAGVAAGLRLTHPGTLGAAWTRDGTGADAAMEIELPCLHAWQFQTGLAGDFTSLAEKLVPEPAPWSLGRRILDASRPRGELPALTAGDPGRLQVVRGPLVSPADPPEGAPSEDAAWPPAETEKLRVLLNRPDELAGKPSALPADKLPRIGPEIYARHHAAVTRIDPARDVDWLGQLNLAPTNRVVAGLGTRVVQMDQEVLMQSAWAQVGAIEEANRQLRRAQLARFVGGSFHARHLTPLGYGDLLQATRRVHGRVIPSGNVTLHAAVGDSFVAQAAVTAAFRRTTRPRGPLARYAGGVGRTQLAGLVARDGAARDFRRAYRDLDGVAGVSELAARALEPEIVSRVLRLDDARPETSAAALVEHGRRLAGTEAFPEALAARAAEGIRLREGFDPAGLGAKLALEAVESSLPEDVARQPARATSYLTLLAGLQHSGAEVAEKAGALARRIASRLEIEPPHFGGTTIAFRSGPATPALRFSTEVRSGIFALETPGERLLRSVAESAGIARDAAAAGLAAIGSELVAPDWPGTPALPPLTVAAGAILTALDPAHTVTKRITARIGVFPKWLPSDWFEDGLVQPIMAAPVFTRPMYQALDAYDRDWLIPGLGKITEPDFVTLLETNAAFMEGFLVGLSHEFARELLWRGYPTDQRGTYFRRFWGSADELVADIHRFAQTALKTHIVAKLADRLVLLVRGELIRRYPDAIVLGLRAKNWDKPPVFEDPTFDPSSMAGILFHVHLEPDIVLVGFDLSVADVEADPWWFIIAEHPTAPRFGLHESRPAGKDLYRDTLSWDDLTRRLGFLDGTQSKAIQESASDTTKTSFGRDAASIAHLLLHDPVRAAFQGKRLIGPIKQKP